MRNLLAFTSGGLFGAGLLLSGTTDTRIIHGWLDLLSGFDPTLGFMFLGSATLMVAAWRIASRKRTSLLGTKMPVKSAARFDRRLIVGSVMFGIGWGLTGICPGPSMAAIFFGGTSGVVFLGSMIIGMLMAVPIGKPSGEGWLRYFQAA